MSAKLNDAREDTPLYTVTVVYTSDFIRSNLVCVFSGGQVKLSKHRQRHALVCCRTEPTDPDHRVVDHRAKKISFLIQR